MTATAPFLLAVALDARMDRARIIAEIRRTASENEGVPLGQRRFAETTAISVGVWRGKYWRTWSDALQEAGFAANSPKEAHERSALIACMIALTRRNGRFPTYADLRMERQTDLSFPAHQAFNKLGSRSARIEIVRAYVAEHPEDRDVIVFLPSTEEAADAVGGDDGRGVEGGDGSVYMLKLGKHHKIGKTFSVPRRHREIALELPEKPEVIHVITSDDPSGIEAYWHARFAAKRTNGEWFSLTREDVRAFKRRKFM